MQKITSEFSEFLKYNLIFFTKNSIDATMFYLYSNWVPYLYKRREFWEKFSGYLYFVKADC